MGARGLLMTKLTARRALNSLPAVVEAGDLIFVKKYGRIFEYLVNNSGGIDPINSGPEAIMLFDPSSNLIIDCDRSNYFVIELNKNINVQIIGNGSLQKITLLIKQAGDFTLSISGLFNHQNKSYAPKLGEGSVSRLGLDFNVFTTQYDYVAYVASN
jgi:hypothetical protein